MPQVTNYSSLVSTVIELIEDTSTEVANFIPTAVNLAEQKLLRELDTTGNLKQVAVTAAAGTRLVTKPSDYKFAFEVRLVLPSSERAFLQKKTRSYVEDYWPFAETSTGIPKYYGDWDQTRWILAPTPNSDYVIETAIQQKPTNLNATTSTNFFTQEAPDILLAATMQEMCIYTRNNKYLSVWNDKYNALVTAFNNEERRERTDSNTRTNNTSPTENNLIPMTN